MAKLNHRDVRPAVSSVVRTGRDPTGVTYEGAPGYGRDARSELFLLAVANMVGEDTFYERAGDRDDRYATLVRRLAVEDPEWTAAFLTWLRAEGNMRTAAIVGAAEYVKGRLDVSAAPDGASDAAANRRVIASVLRRADEPGELLAYWRSAYGRAIPKPVKRGIADAVGRLYTEFNLLKYDSEARGYRFGDVIDLVRPAPRTDEQSDLFRYAIERRHNRDDPPPASLTMIRNRAELMSRPVAVRRALFDTDDAVRTLRDAGMTWESVGGWLQGPMDAAVWTALIPTMGFMALLRNLRNLDEAGVSDEVAERVAARLADPEQVARSRQFPFRFLAAYRAAPSLRWGHALERALTLSLGNVPALPGRTLILVDRSGSMFGPMSRRSGLNRADAAAVFGAALAVRAEGADLVEFGTGHRPVRFRRTDPILRILDRFGNLGGTNTAEAVRANFRRHDRVVIVSDEQAWIGPRGADPLAAVPETVPSYTWNLAGYRYGHGPSGERNRHAFGGLTDQAFRMIPLIESGRDGVWPWEATA